MTPQKQTILHAPGVRGDCFRACIASIFELPVESVPHFVEMGAREWWAATQRWLGERGLMALEVRIGEGSWLDSPGEKVSCIITGKSPRGGGIFHCVVGELDRWSLKVVHDPHPSNAGIEGPPLAALFFVPLHPERFTKQ